MSGLNGISFSKIGNQQKPKEAYETVDISTQSGQKRLAEASELLTSPEAGKIEDQIASGETKIKLPTQETIESRKSFQEIQQQHQQILQGITRSILY